MRRNQNHNADIFPACLPASFLILETLNDAHAPEECNAYLFVITTESVPQHVICILLPRCLTCAEYRWFVPRSLFKISCLFLKDNASPLWNNNYNFSLIFSSSLELKQKLSLLWLKYVQDVSQKRYLPDVKTILITKKHILN